jgi:hypothetical protein
VSAEQGINEAAVEGDGAWRFAAFISYSHSDEAIAAKLHKAIETYRFPATLRDVSGADVAGGRIGRVFRDRADLAAADSLSDAIREALADSGALIVLCSPEARESRWVDAEIRLFRELHQAAPVLAAVVRGEPAAAMPPALTEGGREPLAADLREAGDGWKLGFLKIAAALAKVPLDALIQRDAQRKFRRVMAVTVGALIAVLLMGAMTTYAIQQRNEAERQRAQAEGLVEFMLTDLRDSLRGVGRIDIMRSAVGNALESYGEGNARGALSPDSQGQLARLLHAVGEDDFNANRLEEAARSFRQAYRITAPLLADAPRDADRIYNHAQSEYWLGRIRLSNESNIHTTRHWNRYRDLAYRLNDVEPDSQRSLQEIAFSDGNLCALGRVNAISGTSPSSVTVLPLCHSSVEAQRALVTRFPEDIEVVITLANRLAWLADASDREAGAGSGDRYRAEQLSIARRLARRHPDNWDVRDYLVRALISSGVAANSDSSEANGAAFWTEARQLLIQMRRHDPSNRSWQQLEAMVR